MAFLNPKVVITADDQTGSAFGSLRSNIDKTTDASKAFAGAMMGVGVVLGGIIGKSILTAARTETLGIAMNTVARATGTSIETLKEQEAILKKQGITTQEARGILTLFMQSQLDVAQASKVARVAQDLAVISGKNSSDTARDLTDAITTQNPLLIRQYGIVKNLPEIYDSYAASIGKTASQLTETEKKQAMINSILEAGQKVTGAYEEAMTTAGKKMTSLARYVEEAANSIGNIFLPYFGKLIDALTEFLKNITTENVQKWVEWLDKSGVAMLIVGGIVGGLTPAFLSLAGSILLNMLYLAPWIALGAILAYTWEKNRSLFYAIVIGITAIGIAILVTMLPAIGAAIIGFGAMVVAALPFIAIGLIVGALAYIIISNWEVIKNWFIGFWRGLVEGFSVIGEFIKNVFQKVIEVATGIIDWFKELPGKIWDAIKNIANKFWDVVTNAYENVKRGGETIIQWFKDLPGKIGEIIIKIIPKIFGDPLKEIGRQMREKGVSENEIPPRFRAFGGYAEAGQSYIVGEAGPELFVPSQSGTVKPKGSFGMQGGGGNTNIVVNIGMYAGTETEKRRIAEDLLKAVGDRARARNIGLSQYLEVI